MLLSAHSPPQIAKEALALGAYRVVNKPIDMKDVPDWYVMRPVHVRMTPNPRTSTLSLLAFQCLKIRDERIDILLRQRVLLHLGFSGGLRLGRHPFRIDDPLPDLVG